MHYSSAGEEITDHLELGVYLYPKDQEPEYRQVLHIMSAGSVDIPPNTVKVTEGFFPMRSAGRIEKLPTAHASAWHGDVHGGDLPDRPA